VEATPAPLQSGAADAAGVTRTDTAIPPSRPPTVTSAMRRRVFTLNFIINILSLLAN
jgi:hypothetical protein